MSELIASDRPSFEMAVDSRVYGLLVCQKACYALMGEISCQLSVDESEIVIAVTALPECELDEGQIRSLLLDELLDYSLREKIGEATETVRNIILSNAFSNTKLVG